MRVTATCYIVAGEHERFGPDLAKTMIGQTRSNGQKVIAARNISTTEIELTVEFDYPTS